VGVNKGFEKHNFIRKHSHVLIMSYLKGIRVFYNVHPYEKNAEKATSIVRKQLSNNPILNFYKYDEEDTTLGLLKKAYAEADWDIKQLQACYKELVKAGLVQEGTIDVSEWDYPETEEEENDFFLKTEINKKIKKQIMETHGVEDAERIQNKAFEKSYKIREGKNGAAYEEGYLPVEIHNMGSLLLEPELYAIEYSKPLKSLVKALLKRLQDKGHLVAKLSRDQFGNPLVLEMPCSLDIPAIKKLNHELPRFSTSWPVLEDKNLLKRDVNFLKDFLQILEDELRKQKFLK